MKQFGTVFIILLLSTVCVNAQITSAASGNWSAGATWVGGVAPTGTDNVVIANGHTVTLNTDASVASLVVGGGTSGALAFNSAASNTLTVTGNLTVATGGSIAATQSRLVTTGTVTAASTSVTVASTAGIAAGMAIKGYGITTGTTVATVVDGTTLTISVAATASAAGVPISVGYNHAFLLAGNLVNNGTFDMSNGDSTGVCNVTFNNTTGDQTITGTGATTRFSQVTLAKGAITNKVLASIDVSMSGNNIIFTSGTWEQTAGRLTATSGSISVGTAVGTTFGFSITGSGSAWIASNINNFGALLINTTDSVIVGSGDSKIDMTNGGGSATFTNGTILIYGKFVSASPSNTTINGAQIVIDPKGMTSGYAVRTTSGSGGIPFTFTSGSITILNPCSLVTMEAQFNASTAMVTSTNARLILGQGASTVATPNGFRIGHNTATTLGNLTVNTGSVGVTLSTNVKVSGTLTLTSSGALGGSFKWTAPRYVFNGSAAQVTGSIMPDTVKVVVVDNPAGVTSSQALAITDTLYLNRGTLSGPYTAGFTTDVELISATLPAAFDLAQNYPNPFNPSTVIRYQLPSAEHVVLQVFDMLGREIAALVNERQEAGTYTATFDARGLSSGMYLCRLSAGSFIQLRKMLLTK